jgi:hypothetical protein
MNILNTILEFWWLALLLIPAYLMYMRTKQGKGVGSFGLDETKLIIFYVFIIILIYLCQRYLFSQHFYLLFYIIIFFPLFAAFIYILLMRDNVFIIESTMDCEIFYDLKYLEKQIAEATRTRAFMIDRDAYREIRHIGEVDYGYWNGGDGVKFTDYFDQREGVMYHPPISLLHNVSFYIAKSFWLRMKIDLPELMRTNALLTWLKPYTVAYEQSKLAKNFKMRLLNLERQYQDEPFNLSDDIKKLWEHEYEQRRLDREAGETKTPSETPATPAPAVKPESINLGGEK